jgi:hypothetical protein
MKNVDVKVFDNAMGLAITLHVDYVHTVLSVTIHRYVVCKWATTLNIVKEAYRAKYIQGCTEVI